MTERQREEGQRHVPEEALGLEPRVEDRRRPFYLIAHKCNSVEAVRESLDLGANAIECDLRYAGKNNCFVVNHDTTLFRARDHCEPFLDGVRELVQSGRKLALAIFDCKIDEPGCAVPLLELLRARLTDHVNINIIISVASYDKQRHLLAELGGRLRPNEGVAIDEDNDPYRCARFFEEHGLPNHGYANGTFPLGPGPTIPSSTMDAIALKALGRQLDFVYGWTYRSQDSMRNFVRMGIDGLAVDDVTRLSEVLAEPECAALVRLAEPGEPLFTRPPDPAYVLEVTTGERWRAGTDADLCFMLRGSKGVLSSELSAAPARLFERGRTDRVTLYGHDIGVPQAVSVSRDGTGRAPDWLLDRIVVRSNQFEGAYGCVFKQWIPAGGEVARELAPLEGDRAVAD